MRMERPHTVLLLQGFTHNQLLQDFCTKQFNLSVFCRCSIHWWSAPQPPVIHGVSFRCWVANRNTKWLYVHIVLHILSLDNKKPQTPEVDTWSDTICHDSVLIVIGPYFVGSVSSFILIVSLYVRFWLAFPIVSCYLFGSFHGPRLWLSLCFQFCLFLFLCVSVKLFGRLYFDFLLVYLPIQCVGGLLSPPVLVLTCFSSPLVILVYFRLFQSAESCSAFSSSCRSSLFCIFQRFEVLGFPLSFGFYFLGLKNNNKIAIRIPLHLPCVLSVFGSCLTSESWHYILVVFYCWLMKFYTCSLADHAICFGSYWPRRF